MFDIILMALVLPCLPPLGLPCCRLLHTHTHNTHSLTHSLTHSHTHTHVSWHETFFTFCIYIVFIHFLQLYVLFFHGVP